LGSTPALAGEYTIAETLFFVGFAGVLSRHALDNLLCLLRSTLFHDFWSKRPIDVPEVGRDRTSPHVIYVA
jgi:hypothetical protein